MNNTDEFSFDFWVALAKEDPDAFEAQRTAVLGLALARGSETQRERGREALARFEKAAAGCSVAERIDLAGQHLTASLRELERSLDQTVNGLQHVRDSALPT